jgi:hypothetical protein
MWRVVLRSLIEVCFHGAAKEDQDDWAKALQSFIKDSSRSTFLNEDKITKVSVHHIVK